MKIIFNPIEMQQYTKNSAKKSIGFVPTMGALHLGHASLLKKARLENDLVVLSIFVNPTQFNDPKDFEKYPATWDEDLKIAEEVGVDILFAPNFESIYPDKYRYKITENDLSQFLCGASRAGHFDGVLTIVNKLFNIIRPHRVYFGEKDYQQLLLIKGMIDAFFMDIELVPVPTLRETDGLAMSSRNLRLSSEQRKIAPKMYSIIRESQSPDEASKKLMEAGFRVDYVEDRLQRRFVAAFLGDVRLIDNVAI